MQNLILTQLSIPEVQQLFRKELEEYFSKNPLTSMPKKSEPNDYVTKKEAAKLLSCSVSTIDNYRRSGKLNRYNVGSAVRFKRAEIISIIEDKQK